MDLNRATIIGNLTRDPEVRSTPTGKSVSSFGVATNRYWNDANGQKQKAAEFHNVVFWGKLAEIAGQYLKKGQRIYVEGRLQTREWTGQDGIKRYRTEIVGENMIMLSARQGGDSSGFSGASAVTGSMASDSAGGPDEVMEEEIKVEDIPF
jgi:single-strand DNA-binding protein